MTPKAQRTAATVLLIGTTLVVFATVPGIIDVWDVNNDRAWGFRGFGLVASMIFALAGALLSFKRPENPVGWLFAAVGAAFAVITAGETYAVAPLIQGDDGGVKYQIAWLTSWGWILFLGLVAFSILLFPSGHLPGPRWIGRARLIAAGFAFGCLSFAFAPGPLNNMPARITNRYALPESTLTEIVVNAGMLSFIGALVLAAVGVVQRYRSARGLQKQQMKLFALAAAAQAASMVLVIVVLFFAPRFADVVELLSSLAMMSIPVGMTVAILRYGLYEIDLIINRALVYTVLSGILVLVYLGGVVLLQQLLAPVTADSDVVVAASTLAVAALFRPLRSRVQSFIDRRFYRSKYDAAATLGVFSSRLKDEIDLSSMGRELMAIVGATFQPAHASVWLKPPEETGPR